MHVWKSYATLVFCAALILLICGIDASAFQVKCNCTVYAVGNVVDTLVIDNDSGWQQQVPGTTRHTTNLEPIIGLPERTPEANSGAYFNWSNGDIKCIELKHVHAIFAIRLGSIGQAYECNGVRFVIEAIGTQAHDDTDKIYWISSNATYPNVSHNFVYTQKRGIVSIGGGVPRNSAETVLFLVSGPGLLGPGGLPNNQH